MSATVIGKIIQDNFEILDKIGQGGMATVYRARQISLDRVVAIKMLSAALVDIGDFRDRFLQEAKIIARLTHPHIVQVYDVFELQTGDGGVCIVMEYLEGESLHQGMMKDRPLEVDRALGIAEQVAAGLAYAHDKDVVHRDIKPHNIMLLPGDVVKIMDFGIARFRGSSVRTQTGATLGTPEYMSPEQAEGKPVDARSDLYSLAVVLYTMVTGEPPFTADSPVAIGLKHIQDTPRSPRGLNPKVKPEVESVILKGMAKNPDDRYRTALDFREALINSCPTSRFDATDHGEMQTVVVGEKKGAPSREEALPRPARPPKAAWIAGAAVGLGILAIIVWAILPRGGQETNRLTGEQPRDIQPTVTPVPSRTPMEPGPDVAAITPTPVGPGPDTPDVTPTPAPAALPARDVELAMRRLNEQAAADPGKAMSAFAGARANASTLAAAGGAPGDGTLLMQCLNGFIDGIVYDRENWEHHAGLARFLVDNVDRWTLSGPVRGGLLRDARELVRRAKMLCDDDAQEKTLDNLEETIEARLESSGQ